MSKEVKRLVQILVRNEYLQPCLIQINCQLSLTDPSDTEETDFFEKKYLSLEDYDCIGFDLDHTLCRYNVGPMIRYLKSRLSNIFLTVVHFRLEYELLADFLVEKRGYDPSLQQKAYDTDSDFVCKVKRKVVDLSP